MTVRFIINNDADAATLSASPALETTLPETNLQDATRARVARTTGLTDQVIKGTWSALKVVSAIAMLRHNLSIAATWRLQLYSDAAWTTEVYDSTAVAVNPPMGWGEINWGIDAWGDSVFTGWDHAFAEMWFTAVSVRSFKLTLSDPTNADGYMQASRLFVGNYFEPLVNFDYDLSLSWLEDSKQQRTAGGTLRTDAGEPYREWEFRLSWLDAGERAKIMEMFRKVGLRKDMYISCYPEEGSAKERDHAGQVKLVSSPRTGHSRTKYWNVPLKFEEA